MLLFESEFVHTFQTRISPFLFALLFHQDSLSSAEKINEGTLCAMRADSMSIRQFVFLCLLLTGVPAGLCGHDSLPLVKMSPLSASNVGEGGKRHDVTGTFVYTANTPPPWALISISSPGGSPFELPAGLGIDLITEAHLTALVGVLMLVAAMWVVILRRQVKSKTREIREWLRREAVLTARYRDLL